MIKNVSTKDRIRIISFAVLSAFLFLFSPYLKSFLSDLKQEPPKEYDVVSITHTNKPTITTTPTMEPKKEYVCSIKESDVAVSPIVLETLDLKPFISYNPKTIGAIAVPGTNIYYPILDADNYEEWISKDFSLNKSYHGTVFLEPDNNPNFSNQINTLFGHNMRDGSMFANVNKFVRRDKFVTDNPYLFLTTKDGISVYLAVGATTIGKDDEDYKQTKFSYYEEYNTYFKKILANLKKKNENYIQTDKILQLVTCASNNIYRTVVFYSKAFDIPNPVVTTDDISNDIKSITKANENYKPLFVKVVSYRLENTSNSFMIFDKNGRKYIWTKDKLTKNYQDDIGDDIIYINGYSTINIDGVRFSICEVDGVTYLLAIENELVNVLNANVTFTIKKENIKIKKIRIDNNIN